MIYYYLYKTTNNINGKIYIGVHHTKKLDDGYIGSGTVILQAIKKYGKENFTKEILQYFDNLEDMLEMECIIVNEDFVKRDDTYNCALGGGGIIGDKKGYGQNYLSEEGRKRLKEAASKNQKGSGNSQFGTCGINNGVENKKIKKDELASYLENKGIKGRVMGKRGPMSPEHKAKIGKANKIRTSNRKGMHKDNMQENVKMENIEKRLSEGGQFGMLKRT